MPVFIDIFINECRKDTITVENISGDPNGTCLYDVFSKEHGFVGHVYHDRRNGMYALSMLAIDLVNKKDQSEDSRYKGSICPVCKKEIYIGETIINEEDVNYHADCKLYGKHIKGD